MRSDAEKYVAFFKETLAFFDTYEDLVEMWRDQADSRTLLGLSVDQHRDLVQACAARHRAIRETEGAVDEAIPVRPGREP